MKYLRSFAQLFRLLLYIALFGGAFFALFGLFGRRDYLLERQIAIAAPLDLVYDQVRYFRNFRVWSPWAGMEADIAIEGEDGSTGAVYRWSGRGEIGQGQLQLKALAPDRLDFEVRTEKPYRSTSPTWFTFEADGAQTQVKWYFHMHIAYPWNGLAMFTDINVGVGKDFSQGLENLKRHCEAMMPRLFEGYEVRKEEQVRRAYAGIRGQMALEQVPAFLEQQFKQIDALVQSGQLRAFGPKVALFWRLDSLSQQADVSAAVAVDSSTQPLPPLEVFLLEPGTSYWIKCADTLDLNAAQKALARYAEVKGQIPLPPLVVEYEQGAQPQKDKRLVPMRVSTRAAAPPPDTLEERENEQ